MRTQEIVKSLVICGDSTNLLSYAEIVNMRVIAFAYKCLLCCSGSWERVFWIGSSGAGEPSISMLADEQTIPA